MKTSEGGGSDPPSATGAGGAAAEGDPMALVMKRFPFFLELRERYTSVSGEPSFATLPRFATTEAEHAMRREDVVNLVLQWLAQRGFSRSVRSLQEGTGVERWDLGLGEDLLPALLQAAAPSDPGAVFSVLGDDLLARQLSDEADEEDPEVELQDELAGGAWAELEESPAAAEQSWREGETTAQDVMMTPGQVCRSLVSGSNSELRQVFAATWTQWSTCGDVLRRLFQFYYVPESILGSVEEATQHAGKVVRAIVWFVVMGNGPRELTNGLVGRFAGRLFDAGKSKHASELRQALARVASMDDPSLGKPKNWEDPLVPKNIFSPTLALGDVPVLEVARQLTLIDFGIFSKVTPNELLSRGWLSSSERAQRSAPHVCQLLLRFRVLESWAAGSVAAENGSEAASQVLTYFLSLIKCLMDLNSFHSAAALWGGVSCESVWRLKGAFTNLSSEHKQLVSQLEVNLSSWRGFAAYKRLYLDAAAAGIPAIPFLQPHLQGLIMVSLSSPSLFGSLVNWPKFVTLQRLLADLKLGGYNRFPFLVVVQIQNFLQTEKLSFYLPKESE